MDDPHWETALDIGRYESGFAIPPSLPTRAVKPGGEALYALRVQPSDLSFTVTMTATGPPPA